MKQYKIEVKPDRLESQQNFKGSPDSNHDAEKILFIEDNEDVTTLLQSFLKEYFNEDELNIFDEKSGHAGIETAATIKPDLIILDIVLPDISGIEVYNRLENHPNTSHTKFIIISGKAEYEPDRAIFLQKPFKMDEFVAIVKRLLKIKT